jgi:uncharacterized protein
MGLREPAWRVTTAELESSSFEERGEGDRAATFVLSPFGARMNRVVLAGTLSAAEAIGRETPESFWRARLADPLGTVSVTAGSFQPRAMVQLRAAPPGRPAVVVGKVHLYRGRDDRATLSVRAEAVRSVAESDERATLAEVVRHTLDRLDLVDRLVHEPATPDSELRASGAPDAWVRAARKAVRQYPDVDRAAFRERLRLAVARVAGRGLLPPRPEPRASVRVATDAVAVAPPAPSEADRTVDATFLDLVDRAAEASADGYADVRELLARLADRGVETARAEAALGRLEEGGVLEEPLAGKLRRA